VPARRTPARNGTLTLAPALHPTPATRRVRTDERIADPALPTYNNLYTYYLKDEDLYE
jgi:hypothetical protein